jgi:putative ABC transport system substrate-binding protein
LQIHIVNASTGREIEEAFAALGREQADALFVAADSFFNSRPGRLVTLAAHYRIPATYNAREAVEIGGLMSYGTDRADMFRQVGVYTGQILKGAKPADLPVLQASKFEFVINAQTARLLGIEVPNALQLLADEIIE